MSEEGPNPLRPENIQQAIEQLLAGSLDRRSFVRAAQGFGVAATAAASMVGACSSLMDKAQAHSKISGKRPNIVLILVDDMGFGDLGVMGSEIRTPNIDALAHNGITLSAMYNCARCCPTRSSLLTGLYPHKAGIGHMGANLGSPAYQGFLRNDAATIAELLQPAGYRTLMAGKWHVGGDFWARRVDSWKVGDVEHPTPRQRGFDRFYGIIDGTINYFSPWYIMEDDRRVQVSPTDYYFTDAITDKAIAMIEESVPLGKPFFLYLAHAAPHWPLHAHPQDIAKYEGVYTKGWDATRTARHERMQAENVLPHKWDISPRDPHAPAWSDAEHKDWEASRMQVYAAQMDRMDQQIGRVIETLKRLGQYDDTMIMLFSDNGGCAETMRAGGWAQFYPDVTNDGKAIKLGNDPTVQPGSAQSFMSYDLPWANVSNVPFRLFKHWVHEGGISTPMIVQWPSRFAPQGKSHAACHVVDVLPTILEAARVAYPKELGGHVMQELDGESLLPLFDGRRWQRDTALNWEHEGNRAIRVDSLKLVRSFEGRWELYDMEKDRTELHNLGERYPGTVQKLAAQHDIWSKNVGVIDWKILQPKLLKAWNISQSDG